MTVSLLVAHGSRDPRSAATVRRIAAAAGVTAAFLDFDEPGPAGLLDELAAAGHRAVTLIPLLLTHAHHARVDIPAVADAARRRHPRLRVRITDGVGGAALLPALERGLPDDCDAVVLAAAGTRHAPARAGIARLAARLAARRGVPALVGYAAGSPSVGEAVAALAAAGAHRVAVASYFIAPGRLPDRAERQARDRGAIAVTGVLGDCPELVAAVRARHRTPTDSRVDGTTSSTAVPSPSNQAGTANHHSPAWAR